MSRRVPYIPDRAEGMVKNWPFGIEFNPDGTRTAHFWMGDKPSEETAAKLFVIVKRHFPYVTDFTYCEGAPYGAWTGANYTS